MKQFRFPRNNMITFALLVLALIYGVLLFSTGTKTVTSKNSCVHETVKSFSSISMMNHSADTKSPSPHSGSHHDCSMAPCCSVVVDTCVIAMNLILTERKIISSIIELSSVFLPPVQKPPSV